MKDRTNKDEILKLRVTHEEKEEVRKRAAMLGLSISAFVLAECLGEQIGQIIIDGFERNKK